MDSSPIQSEIISLQDSPGSTSEFVDTCTPPAPKRKGHFNIGLYAKRRKLTMEKLIDEKIATDIKIKSFHNKLNYRKRKCDDLEQQLPPPKQKARMPNTESNLDKENSDLLDLSKAQSHRRHTSTLKALRKVHCSPRSTDNTPIMNGMWSTLVNNNPTNFMESLIGTSKVCTRKVIPNIVKKNVLSYENSEDNFIRSTALLYKGGMLTKVKYKEMRKEKVNFMPDVPVPRPVAYDRLMSYIKGINMGEILDLEDFAAEKKKSPVPGVYRPLESLLLRLADTYLLLDEESQFLHWFNGQKGNFLVAIGADGAPFGKDETATSYLVSFLNILEGVQSCDHSYLLMGANCDENHELMIEYTKHVMGEMEAIESKNYQQRGKTITFQCKLIPSDQKWMSSMAGELNNAATYFSSFAAVSKKDINIIDGKIGNDSSCTWKKWSYKKRIQDAQSVKKFKEKNKIPESSKNSNHRKKITEHIASIKSRQEFIPPLGKYVDNLKPEPLHNSNNAWQHWNLDALTTAMQLTARANIDKANGNITHLASTTPIAKYMSLLKDTMKAGRLYKNLVKWFSEKKKSEDFSYRFTGKESKLFCWHFMKICKALIATKGISNTTLLHVYSLAYSGLCLRNCVSLFSRVHINESDVNCLRNECEQYYKCQAILLNKIKPTTWTIGKAIPHFTAEIYHDLGFGLGLNSMQGREAKHAKLACYAKNTTKGKHLCWWQIFKHEFMELIRLKEKDHKQVARKLKNAPHSENESIQEGSTKDKYIPSYCLNNNNFCVCGQPKSISQTACDVCSSDMFKAVMQSCQEGNVNRKLKEMVPQLRIG